MPDTPSPPIANHRPGTGFTAMVLLLVTAVLALSLVPPGGDRLQDARTDAWLHAMTLSDTLPLDIQSQLLPGAGKPHDGGQDDRAGTESSLPAITLPVASDATGPATVPRRAATSPVPLKDSALAPRAPPAT